MSALLAGPRSAGGAVYYVATTGADGNAGTVSAPWRTIQHAADVMGSGDTVLVRGGTYRESVGLSRGGLPGSPVRFATYPGETVIMQGDESLYAGFTSDSTRNISDIEVDGFVIRDYRAFGVVFWSVNDRLTLTRLDIGGNGGTGIRISNSDGTRVQFVRLEGNAGGFDCTPILPGTANDPGCTNLYIGDTQAIDNGSGDDTGVDAFAVEAGSDILVERCLAAGGPGDGFDFKSDRTTLSRVIARDARNNIKMWGRESVLVNALAYNARADANLVLAGGGSYTVANVTIANMTGYAYLAVFGDGDGTTPVRLHNAVFANDNPEMGGTLVWFAEGVQLDVDNNLYFNPYRSDALVCASFPPYEYDCFSADDINGETGHPWMEVNGVAADPLFVNSAAGSFRVGDGSPAIDAGRALGAPPVDLDGRPRPQGLGVDIGAYEFGPNEATATPAPPATVTPTVPASPTRTRSPTWTPRPTVTRTPTGTRRPTETPRATPRPTWTRTPTRTARPTVTRTPTITPRPTSVRTATVTRRPTVTRTPTITPRPTRVRTATVTPRPTRTRTPTITPWWLKTRRPTLTATPVRPPGSG